MRLAPLLLLVCAAANAQQLDMKFSCSTTRDEDERVIYADTGEFKLDGTKIDAFHWESSLFRPTHGFDCSIDEGDGLQAETMGDDGRAKWRVSLTNAQQARNQRGFDFTRGLNCTIRLEKDGDEVHVKPSCPALCGSRSNFSELSVNVKTGACRYEE